MIASTSGGTCTDPNGLSGICKSIRECSSVSSNLLKKQNDISYIQYIRDSNRICNSNEQIICCPHELKNEILFKLPTVEDGCGLINKTSDEQSSNSGYVRENHFKL